MEINKIYKVAYITGSNSQISYTLKSTIDEININNGIIKEIAQSQSTSAQGYTIVTITIIYQIN